MKAVLWVGRHLWLVPCILLFAFLVVPSLLVVATSFNGSQFVAFPPSHLSLQWYGQFFSQSAWLTSLWHSIEVCVGSAVLAAALGTPACVALVRSRCFGLGTLRAALIAPIVLPTIVLGIGLYQVFAYVHLVGTVFGLVLAYTVLGIPIVVLTVSAGLEAVGEELERAARSLGAPPLVAFLRVTLPLISTSILAGGVFVVVAGLSEVVIASLISGTTAVTLPLQT